MPLSELEARVDVALAPGRPVETAVRDLLAIVCEATGLSTTYLARAHMQTDEQEILYSHNAGEDLFVPEDIKLPWSEGVCSFVHAGRAPEFTDNVPRDISGSQVAKLMGYQSFLSLPVFRQGLFFGTLCGCSASAVPMTAETLEFVRACANRVGALLPDDDPE